MSSSSSIQKVAKKAVKATKKIVSEISEMSTSESIMTPSFSETKSKTIVNTITNFRKNKKFKWILITIVLIFIISRYFKSIKKSKKTKKPVDEKYKIVLDNKGKPSLVNASNENMANNQAPKQYTQEQLNNISKLANMVTPQMPMPQMPMPQMPQMPPMPPIQIPMPPIPIQPMPPIQVPEIVPTRTKKSKKVITESSEEEDISEDENISSHNLTVGEIDAINKQLDDVNIDNMQ
jgi:hypothetical protein